MSALVIGLVVGLAVGALLIFCCVRSICREKKVRRGVIWFVWPS